MSRETKNEEEEPSEVGPHHARAVRNLLLIVLCGTIGVAWVFWRTPWFDKVSSFLALGGTLSWLAFVVKILPEDESKRMQLWIFHSLLTHRWTPRITTIILGIFLLVASRYGTLEVKAFGIDSPRRVLLFAGNESVPIAKRLLLPGNSLRFVLGAAWCSETSYRVKVQGMPEIETQCTAWRKNTLAAPGSFARPAFLIRPDLSLANQITEPWDLDVWVVGSRQQHFELPDYRGQAVWVGCDSDVDLPDPLKAEIQKSSGKFEALWLYPEAVTNRYFPLVRGDRLRIKLSTMHGEVVSSATAELEASAFGREFTPTVVVLKDTR